MSQAQLANLLITNNQTLGYKALNSVQMYNALVQAGVSDEIAKATVKQVLQTQATNAQTTATIAATGATGGLTAAIKGLGATLSAFALAHPLITAITAIVAVIAIAVTAHKKHIDNALLTFFHAVTLSFYIFIRNNLLQSFQILIRKFKSFVA